MTHENLNKPPKDFPAFPIIFPLLSSEIPLAKKSSYVTNFKMNSFQSILTFCCLEKLFPRINLLSIGIKLIQEP